MNQSQPLCNCFQSSRIIPIHAEPQDTESDAWRSLLQLVDRCAETGEIEFDPGQALGWEAWWKIVRLPSSIAKLKSVRRMVLYGSNLDRIPPEIGEMESLEDFDPYTSYRLHWFPFEITRCRRLRTSRVSTRALYGNFKFRHCFPRLYDTFDSLGALTPTECSVCRAPLGTTIVRRWVSLRIATDVMPLLVNACSQLCVESIPTPPEGYVAFPHSGGTEVKQPPARR
jgi:hypothetical protein